MSGPDIVCTIAPGVAVDLENLLAASILEQLQAERISLREALLAIAEFGRRLRGGGEGQRGGHLAEPAYLAGAGLAAAQVAGEPVAFGPRLQRVERVGAGQRVQVMPEEPHVSSPPGSRASG